MRLYLRSSSCIQWIRKHGQNWDFSGWSWIFARSVRFAIHLSMTSKTAGRLSATSILVSQPETSDPIQPTSTILLPPPILTSVLVAQSRIFPPMKPLYSGCFVFRITFNLYNPATLIHHCLCILYPLCPPPLRQSCYPFFSPQISHWLRKCDPVCFLPHPLW